MFKVSKGPDPPAPSQCASGLQNISESPDDTRTSFCDTHLVDLVIRPSPVPRHSDTNPAETSARDDPSGHCPKGTSHQAGATTAKKVDGRR
jgi:hypothetical protein